MRIVLNGEPRDLNTSRTVADLLAELNLTGRAVAVEVNKQLIPRKLHASTPLAADDRVEVVSLVGGG